MFFSIIIPALNEENYIGLLLEDLKSQSFSDFEVIVVDGNSDDRTQEIVKSYRDSLNLSLLVSPKRGVAFQRNYGAEKSQADKLMFMDADIRLDSDFLVQISDYIRNKNPDILTVWNKPLSSRPIDHFLSWFYFGVYCSLMSRYEPAAAGTFIYVIKEAFNKVEGFSDEFVWAEDKDFVTRVYKSGYKKYKILKNPKIYFSVRRLDKYGRLDFILKNIKGAYLTHFKGGVTQDKKDKFTYEFGNFK